MSYNPFEKGIGEPIDMSDLQSLVDRVAEGYYVEYKSTFPANDKVGHSIASFANTHGGWYFVGIEANTKTNLPESVLGIDLGRFPDPISKVRDIARASIAPMPVLLPQLVPIRDKFAALAVYVPESDDTPHLTQDGRVYRRQADSSAPIPETDRLALDRLYERGRATTQQFDRFAQDPRTHCQAEESQAWMEVYLSPYPPGLLSSPEILSAHHLESLLSETQEPVKVDLSGVLGDGPGLTGGLPFTHAQTGMASVILRQVEPSKVAFNSLEMELFVDGRSRMLVPLQSLPLWPREWSISSGRVADLLDTLVESDTDTSLAYARLVDLKSAWNVIGYLITFYLNWLPTLGPTIDLQAKVALSNVWRCVPFFDLDSWAEYVDRHGLPVCTRNTMMTPQEGRRPLALNPDQGAFRVWNKLFGLAAVGLGLPPDAMATFVTQSVEGL